jgi:hypothetical protein
MDTKALQDAILNMDRRKVQDEVTSAAKSGLDAAASIGTETPMVVLRDIRRCITDLSETIREREEAEREREARAEARHTEMIATLQSIAIRASVGGGSGPRTSLSRESTSSIWADEEKREFYHYKIKVNTGARVIAVILMQLDTVLKNSGQLPTDAPQDSVILDLKGWTSPILKVAGVESTVTTVKTKVELPKLSQEETVKALEKVSSTIEGRSQPFRVADAVQLQESCSGVIGIVEEIRQRLIKCPGILPESKRTRLAYLKHPYVTREGDLNISMIADGFAKAGPVVVDGVAKFKDDVRKFYISEVLGKGTVPILAFNKSKKFNQPT